MTPFNSAIYQKKINFPNERHVWDGTYKPSLKGYSYINKNIQPGCRTSEHLQLQKNKYRQSGIPNCKAKSLRTNNPPRTVVPDSTSTASEKVEEVVPTTSTILAQKGPTPLDKDTSMGHIYISTNKKHSIFDPKGHTMF